MLAKHFLFLTFVGLCFDCIANGQYCAIENLQIIISSAHEIQANIDICSNRLFSKSCTFNDKIELLVQSRKATDGLKLLIFQPIKPILANFSHFS